MNSLRFLCIISLIFLVSSADVCVDSVTQHDCDFYSKCLEPKFQCGAEGYPMGYGFKYCSKFLSHQQNFPQKGQEWINKTLLCLKQALVPFTTQSKKANTCKNILDSAFDSHPNCYVESGFCELFFQADAIKTMQALLGVYEVQTFANLISIKQVLQTIKLCGVDVIKKIWEIIHGSEMAAGFLAEFPMLN